MGIKEIALKHSREYLTFKLGGRKGLDVAEIVCDDEIYAEIVDELAQQFEAIIESYKAELLKEVGEPVGYHYLPNNEMFPVEEVSRSNLKNNPQDYVFLYTSDQLAAAVLNATKPLEERRCEICGYAEHHREHTSCLRTQLTTAQEEIKTVTEQKNRMWFEMQTAQDQLAKAEQLWQIAQGRCDGLEEKLANAEQRVAEWQPISTAPKDGTRVLLCIDHGEWGDKVWTGVWGDGWMVSYGKARTEPTHWMPLPKAPNGASS